MPHAAFAVLPSAALEEFNKKYGHLDLHWMQVGGEMPGGSIDNCITFQPVQNHVVIGDESG
jgi:hypothetical protein